MALLGQRRALDAMIFDQLVFDRVGRYTGPSPAPPTTAVVTRGGIIRGFPLGLDLLSAFGSPQAAEIIASAHDNQYEQYAGRMEVVRAAVDGFPASAWAADIYLGRLNALRLCLSDPAPGSAAFMQQPQWRLKQHQTALGAWTELRHDTILYTRQTYPEAQSALAQVRKGEEPVPEPVVIKGYVEPCPGVYRNIGQSFGRMVEFLSAAGYPEDQALKTNLEGAAQLMERLAVISEQELAGSHLSGDDYELIEGIGGTFNSLLRFPHYWDVTDQFQDEMDKQMPIVADVVTNLDAAEVLEEAVGRPMFMFAICPVEGKATLCRGVTYSYYELRVPLGYRLTDEEWRAMLESGGAPERPQWTSGFVSPASNN